MWWTIFKCAKHTEKFSTFSVILVQFIANSIPSEIDLDHVVSNWHHDHTNITRKLEWRKRSCAIKRHRFCVLWCLAIFANQLPPNHTSPPKRDKTQGTKHFLKSKSDEVSLDANPQLVHYLWFREQLNGFCINIGKFCWLRSLFSWQKCHHILACVAKIKEKCVPAKGHDFGWHKKPFDTHSCCVPSWTLTVWHVLSKGHFKDRSALAVMSWLGMSKPHTSSNKLLQHKAQSSIWNLLKSHQWQNWHIKNVWDIVTRTRLLHRVHFWHSEWTIFMQEFTMQALVLQCDVMALICHIGHLKIPEKNSTKILVQWQCLRHFHVFVPPQMSFSKVSCGIDLSADCVVVSNWHRRTFGVVIWLYSCHSSAHAAILWVHDERSASPPNVCSLWMIRGGGGRPIQVLPRCRLPALHLHAQNFVKDFRFLDSHVFNHQWQMVKNVKTVKFQTSQNLSICCLLVKFSRMVRMWPFDIWPIPKNLQTPPLAHTPSCIHSCTVCS